MCQRDPARLLNASVVRTLHLCVCRRPCDFDDTLVVEALVVDVLRKAKELELTRFYKQHEMSTSYAVRAVLEQVSVCSRIKKKAKAEGNSCHA